MARRVPVLVVFKRAGVAQGIRHGEHVVVFIKCAKDDSSKRIDFGHHIAARIRFEGGCVTPSIHDPLNAAIGIVIEFDRIPVRVKDSCQTTVLVVLRPRASASERIDDLIKKMRRIGVINELGGVAVPIGHRHQIAASVVVVTDLVTYRVHHRNNSSLRIPQEPHLGTAATDDAVAGEGNDVVVGVGHGQDSTTAAVDFVAQSLRRRQEVSAVHRGIGRVIRHTGGAVNIEPSG